MTTTTATTNPLHEEAVFAMLDEFFLGKPIAAADHPGYRSPYAGEPCVCARYPYRHEIVDLGGGSSQCRLCSMWMSQMGTPLGGTGAPGLPGFGSRPTGLDNFGEYHW